MKLQRAEKCGIFRKRHKPFRVVQSLGQTFWRVVSGGIGESKIDIPIHDP